MAEWIQISDYPNIKKVLELLLNNKESYLTLTGFRYNKIQEKYFINNIYCRLEDNKLYISGNEFNNLYSIYFELDNYKELIINFKQSYENFLLSLTYIDDVILSPDTYKEFESELNDINDEYIVDLIKITIKHILSKNESYSYYSINEQSIQVSITKFYSIIDYREIQKITFQNMNNNKLASFYYDGKILYSYVSYFDENGQYKISNDIFGILKVLKEIMKINTPEC